MTNKRISDLLRNKITLVRNYKPNQTEGIMIVNNKTIYTLELLNLNNIARGSCIPEGLYLVNQRWSEKHKEHYHILNVENRDLILIHVANYVTQLLGCIGVGFVKSDLNKDGIKDITESRKALDFILKELGKEFILEIKN